MKESISYHLLPSQEKLAYQQFVFDQSKIGIVFLTGFMSDMMGTKAQYLSELCKDNKIDFLRFDYRGHGLSDRPFDACTVSMWVEDALFLLDTLTTKPQILIGSSMGGWIMLHVAHKRPKRIRGLLGIAPAPDFTDALLWDKLSQADQETLMTQGRLTQSSDYDNPYIFTKELILDGRRNFILKAPLNLAAPLSILQGMADTSVPWEYVLDFAKQVSAPQVSLTLIQDGDHRLSRPQDLARLENELFFMLKRLS